MQTATMQAATLYAATLKRVIERYARLAEETHQMYEQACIEAESEDFENFHDAFINECFEVVQSQNFDFQNLVWWSNYLGAVREENASTLLNLVMKAHSIEATLQHAVERARGECEQNAHFKKARTIEPILEESDDELLPIQLDRHTVLIVSEPCIRRFSRHGSKKLRSRTVEYPLF